MNANDLKNINKSTRQMILDAMDKHDLTLNQFAKNSGLHQNQLWLYLYSGTDKKGLHSYTMQKIGEYLATLKWGLKQTTTLPTKTR